MRNDILLGDMNRSRHRRIAVLLVLAVTANGCASVQERPAAPPPSDIASWIGATLIT